LSSRAGAGCRALGGTLRGMSISSRPVRPYSEGESPGFQAHAPSSGCPDRRPTDLPTSGPGSRPAGAIRENERLLVQSYRNGREGRVVKTLAFAFGLCIAAVGAVGIVVPASLVWIAQYFVTSGAFVALAAVRIVLGLILISVAPMSRAPTGLRILGYVIVILGITTALTGLMETGELERSSTGGGTRDPGSCGSPAVSSSLSAASSPTPAPQRAALPAALPDRGLKLTGRLGAGARSTRPGRCQGGAGAPKTPARAASHTRRLSRAASHQQRKASPGVIHGQCRAAAPFSRPLRSESDYGVHAQLWETPAQESHA
jgi:hypothetical protein